MKRANQGGPPPQTEHDGVNSEFGGNDGTEPPPPAKRSWLEETPYWAISAALHLAILLILVTIVVSTDEPDDPPIAINIRPPPPPPPKYDPLRAPSDKRREKILHEKKVKHPVINNRPPSEIEPDIPKGVDFTKISDMLRAHSHDATIGITGAQAGAFGLPYGRGRLSRVGSDRASESAVRAALEWLRRHQSPNGSWKSADYVSQCRQVCRNKNPKYGDGRGFPHHDVGVTGLAMLAFTGYGHTHKWGVHKEYVDCLKKAAKYLKKVQQRSVDPALDGLYGTVVEGHSEWIYDHAIATMAMAELLAMSRDAIGLQRSVTAATKLCLRAQNSGAGWRYGVKPGDSDTSVTGWMVLALKAARNARLPIPKADFDRAFRDALRWMDYATAASGRVGYLVPGDAGSHLVGVHGDPYPYSKDLSCMTAVGVLCRLFGGESRGSGAIRAGVDILMRNPPLWQEHKGRIESTINLYHWYYASYALFQFSGPKWKRWNKSMRKALLDTQRKGNIDEDGSWDPIGEWGVAGGRVYSTAIGAMTLEVYYRYLRTPEGQATVKVSRNDKEAR